MKTYFQLMLILGVFSSCSLLSKKEVTPSTDTGTFSATINGANWDGAYCSALAGGTTAAVTLSIVIQKSNKSKTGDDQIILGINNFTGVGTYNIASGSINNLLSITYNGEIYSTNQATNGGTATIKITESTAPTSLLSLGRVVGEISGTAKLIGGTKTITLTNGKFKAIRAL